MQTSCQIAKSSGRLMSGLKKPLSIEDRVFALQCNQFRFNALSKELRIKHEHHQVWYKSQNKKELKLKKKIEIPYDPEIINLSIFQRIQKI